MVMFKVMGILDVIQDENQTRALLDQRKHASCLVLSFRLKYPSATPSHPRHLLGTQSPQCRLPDKPSMHTLAK